MAKTKMRGITVYRKDCTIPMNEEEKALAKRFNVEEYRIPHAFTVRINAAIPPSHPMCEGSR